MPNDKHPSIIHAIRWPLSVLILAVVCWVVFVSLKPETTIPIPPNAPTPTTTHRSDVVVQRDSFYGEQIEPFLKATERANTQVVDRTITTIEETIARYRGGIEPFTEDITSIGTRFGIVTRMPGGWWYEDERVLHYVTGKFEEHLFSEEQLKQEITDALETFRTDIEANQNRMLSRCKAAVNDSDLPGLVIPEYDDYEKVVQSMIVEFSSNKADDTVYIGIVTLVVSETAAVAAQQIIVGLLVSLSTTAATSAAAGGGATAGGAAGGGTVGSLGGPAGTAIGIGVGLVIGIIVDWWMTESFQTELITDLNTYFDDLRNNLIDGKIDSPGLKPTLQRFVEDLNFAQTTVMHKGMLGTQ